MLKEHLEGLTDDIALNILKKFPAKIKPGPQAPPLLL